MGLKANAALKFEASAGSQPPTHNQEPYDTLLY